MSSVILLYYRAPYCDTPELICACDSQQSVNDKIRRLMIEYPHAYPELGRFETSRIEYFERGESNESQIHTT